MARTRPKETLDTNSRFHEREWHIQRGGWILVAIFLALAFAGLFGGGPLSRAQAVNAQGRIDYERFVRNGSPVELLITPARGARHGISKVEITADFAETFRIESITPEPAGVTLSGRQLVYKFAATEPGAAISFHLDPQRLWLHRATVQIDDGAPLQIWQLTYP
jgi:hypothetical protein